MARLFINLLFICFIGAVYAQSPYAPQAGLAGSTAIHKDSSIFIAWANKCTLQRGLLNIADPSLGYASVGDSTSPIGKAGDNNIVSLGDAGEATLEFQYPIKDGIGYDFAVFENSFLPTFLELAFVEVSSDGINFFRFPAHSLTDTTNPIGSFGTVQASDINNLAGKYVANYGTPFDLSELPTNSLLDKQQITHVKIIDVVGSKNSLYARYDSANRAIQDPYPTPFPSGGFDLDAVGVIHIATTSISEVTQLIEVIYPNPVEDVLTVKLKNGIKNKAIYQIVNSFGSIVKLGTLQEQLDVSNMQSGVYHLRIFVGENQSTTKVIKR